MAYLASDSMGGVALYNPSTGQYASSPLPRSPHSIDLLEKKIADGFMPIQDLDTPEGKTHLQKFMNESDQPASMLIREKKSDSAGKVSKLLKNILGKVGKVGKVLPALGILDILGMKKEYDKLMDGTHPMSEFFNESGIGVGNKSTQVYADGGYVTHPFVEDIFDN
tara:strand:- start:739 stop:1236 length:498 start_codon:yes stop_codon:yes gene_type:complete